MGKYLLAALGPFLGVVLGVVLGTSAYGQSLHVNGKFGFLDEYELTASIAAPSRNSKELSGPVLIKHVGICTHNGPDEVEGQIHMRYGGSRSLVSGTVTFEGQTCKYKGRLSKTHRGEMVCPDATVPFYVWTN